MEKLESSSVGSIFLFVSPWKWSGVKLKIIAGNQPQLEPLVSALVDPMQVLFTPCSHVLLQSSSINFGTFLCDVTFSCLFLQFLDPPYAEPSPKFFVTD